MKGELWVKKRHLRGDLEGFGPVWESATQPTHIWLSFPKKEQVFFWALLVWAIERLPGGGCAHVQRRVQQSGYQLADIHNSIPRPAGY